MPPVSATASGRVTLGVFGGRRGGVGALGGLVTRLGCNGFRLGGLGFGLCDRFGLGLGFCDWLGLGSGLGLGLGLCDRLGLGRDGLVGEDVLGEIDRRRQRLVAGLRLHGHPVLDALQRQREAPAL